MKWWAFDIGGANLKLADGCGEIAARPFALWKAPEQLAEELRCLAEGKGEIRQLAVTMTGELADCYVSKTEGVREILSAVQTAFPASIIKIYLTDGRLVEVTEAAEAPLLAAASNWHALASYAGRFAPEATCLLVDIGTTTCDIIPLRDGIPIAQGTTDTTRLLAGELLYTGVERTPCCAVKETIHFRGQTLRMALELFATMRDVYLLRGDLSEDPTDTATADNRPATRADACRRLGKLVCADELEFTADDAQLLASELADHQQACLAAAIRQVCQQAFASPLPEGWIVSGQGEFLARRAIQSLGSSTSETELLSLAEQMGKDASRCAPAHALAVLAAERLS